ncbi:MAG: hypothetical protein AAGG38_11585, partial [Planctomycetota bacterium]
GGEGSGGGGGGDWVAELQAAAGVVGRLPRDAEGWRWLRALRRDRGAWAGYAAAAGELKARDEAAWRSVGLRHLVMLTRLGPARRAMGGEAVRRAVRAWQAQAVQVERERPVGRRLGEAGPAEAAGPGAAGAAALSGAKAIPGSEAISGAGTLPGAEGGLDWADGMTALLVAEAMGQPSVVSAWFAQADADRLDERTEHGGVLTWSPSGSREGAARWIAVGYSAERHLGDTRYVSPDRLIEAVYTGLAHYHFHAQTHDHAAYAGPGRGDLAFTEALDAATLVLTFVDRDTLNVDLVLPGGGVLDLGCVERGGGGRR